ncbi:MAG: helicase (Snf2/Rad54 family) [Candidatus Ozemobacter sibiricus]|jgi:hypothetical protein|uniref:Helicase (Snf2/Rad54 family) n=1 Tax=Candidatus Ozemobacter sibiricus TaxID=2268124 RepID=A0A367ZEH4_9BACT|nr:MAG: helicase (Snf2/Rad54 family) [Candidatus Ozemobacter sibiricus]
MGPDGKPIDILHEFYLPVLSRAVRYDRVAGYFRSSSLAAASQGLSSLVGRAGRIRMIVGADLDPQDVEAVLAGSEQRLADRLNERLSQPQHWDPATMNGVQLLSWLVAHDHLEIRVAFRVHARTGEPLAVDATCDGYVHEKWAVFEDPFGNRIYIAGSLNESKTALARNAENIDVHCEWDNERDAQRVSEAVADFQALWEDRNPGLKVLPLPEAVRQKLISLSRGVRQPREIDGSTMAPVCLAPPSWRERLRFLLIRDGARLPGGLFYGLETAPIQPWPHQDVVARRLVEAFPCSFLLGDEVGLGKTIEAGLAMRTLYLSGLARRLLVAAPASLTRQWQREMAAKFALSFHRLLPGTPARHALLLPEERETTGRDAFQPDLLIVSTGLLVRDDRQADLQAAPVFDLCLLDEAHYARRQGTGSPDPCRAHPRFGRLYRVFRDVLRDRSRSLWLATATPMQLHAVEVADLLALLGRVGPFQFEPALMQEYYDLLGRLLRQEGLEADHWEFLRQAVRGVQQQDPRLWQFLTDSAIDAAVRAILRRWLDLDHPPTASSDRRATLRLLFSLAPLSRVMLRHTRRLLEIYREQGFLRQNLARRTILPMPAIAFTDQERRVYEGLEAYCRELTERIAANAQQRIVTSLGFYLSFLRLRFASSLYAIRATLERRRERIAATLASFEAPLPVDADEDLDEEALSGDDEGDAEVDRVLKERHPDDLRWELEAVEGLLAMLNDLSEPSSKMNELMKVIERRRQAGGRIRQMVVFTRFYDTLTDIVERLRRVAPDLRLGLYSGRGGAWLRPGATALEAVDREQIKHRFLREEIDLLVCTDAAAEGLNLQTADLMSCDFDETGVIPEEEPRRLQEVLDTQAAAEAEEFCSNARLDQVNELVARSQELQNLLVGQGLLAQHHSSDSEESLFWNAVRDLEVMGQADEAVTLDGFAPDLVAGLVGVVVPFQGLTGAPFIRAPGFLQRASLASICRLANRLDVARTELLTSTLLSRLAEEIQAKRKDLSACRMGRRTGRFSWS